MLMNYPGPQNTRTQLTVGHETRPRQFSARKHGLILLDIRPERLPKVGAPAEYLRKESVLSLATAAQTWGILELTAARAMTRATPSSHFRMARPNPTTVGR